MRKNGSVKIGNTEMYYVSFGSGDKKLIVLPGLSDGLATVRGKARLLYFPYRKHLKKYTVYMFSRKNKMPAGYQVWVCNHRGSCKLLIFVMYTITP